MSDLSLMLEPVPMKCGMEYEPGKICRRDERHRGGKHRDWSHPACSDCGHEMKHRAGTATYTCNHSRYSHNQRSTARGLHNAQREIAYAIAGYPDSGHAPTPADYNTARRIAVHLYQLGAFEDDDLAFIANTGRYSERAS